MKETLSLNGSWILALVHDCDFSGPLQTYEQVASAGAIDAVVPGNFEMDLEREGLIPDPFFGKNLLELFQYEDAHVFYARKFTYMPHPGTSPELVFDGLDTMADIYLNGQLVGHAENMYVQHRFTPEGLVSGENQMVVHLRPVCLETRAHSVSAGNVAQKYNYETLRLRKAPHMFSWDIMPRLVSAGIYRAVGIAEIPPERFSQLYLTTHHVDVRHGRAELELFFDLDIARQPVSQFRIAVKGTCGDATFSIEERIWFTAGKLRIKLDDAKLWWPKGYGVPNLYDVTVTLLRSGQPVDSQSLRLGIRTVQLVRTSTTDMFRSGDFYFKVNGKRVFILGTNWVPVDALHARDAERIPKILALLEDIGCNAVRCWGGNIYEDPIFYDACDEMGIMVWQDFAMACAAYPMDPAFCEVLRAETIQVVRALRQHPAILLWAGDNECDVMIGYGRNPNQNRLTREILADVTAFEDPTRPYLPSSPYVDAKAAELPSHYLPENHLWGPRDYFKSAFFKDSLCSFASEIGYHGCPSISSMQRFLSPEAMWPWQNNEEWRIHAASPEATDDGPYVYRIALMAKQIQELFGEIPDTLEDFVLASQISQAEAKKFFVELFRTGQPHRSGIIWWNLIDGWPQFSDAVVDYYFVKKLAYNYLRQSQQPLLLTFTEPHNWQLHLVAVNNAGLALSFDYEVIDSQSGETVLSGSATCQDACVLELNALPYSQGEKRLYVIRWTCAEHSGRNHYLAGNPPFSLGAYRAFLQEVYGDIACLPC